MHGIFHYINYSIMIHVRDSVQNFSLEIMYLYQSLQGLYK